MSPNGVAQLLRCRGKMRHPSRGKAEAAMRSLQARGDARATDYLNVYLCLFCRRYHVGHRIGMNKNA